MSSREVETEASPLAPSASYGRPCRDRDGFGSLWKSVTRASDCRGELGGATPRPQPPSRPHFLPLASCAKWSAKLAPSTVSTRRVG